MKSKDTTQQEATDRKLEELLRGHGGGVMQALFGSAAWLCPDCKARLIAELATVLRSPAEEAYEPDPHEELVQKIARRLRRFNDAWLAGLWVGLSPALDKLLSKAGGDGYEPDARWCDSEVARLDDALREAFAGDIEAEAADAAEEAAVVSHAG